MELKSSKHLENGKLLCQIYKGSYGICRFIYFVDETLLDFSGNADGCDIRYIINPVLPFGAHYVENGTLILSSFIIKFLGENPGACPWDEAKKYFSKSLMSISSEYTLKI